MLVPLTIHYINPTRYGIWLTVSSIIGWVSFFDIGFGNGLRNKFAEALAKHTLTPRMDDVYQAELANLPPKAA